MRQTWLRQVVLCPLFLERPKPYCQFINKIILFNAIINLDFPTFYSYKSFLYIGLYNVMNIDVKLFFHYFDTVLKIGVIFVTLKASENSPVYKRGLFYKRNRELDETVGSCWKRDKQR